MVVLLNKEQHLRTRPNKEEKKPRPKVKGEHNKVWWGVYFIIHVRTKKGKYEIEENFFQLKSEYELKKFRD